MSLVESAINTGTAFLLSWWLQVTLVPILFGVQVSASQGFGMVTMFTFISFVRSYIFRRIFARLERNR